MKKVDPKFKFRKPRKDAKTVKPVRAKGKPNFFEKFKKEGKK